MKQNSIDKDFLAREKFQQRISKGMIGPGSDSWGLPDEVEIIAGDTPLQRYFSGILFPESDIPKYKSQDEIDIADLKNESDETAMQETVLNENEDTDDYQNLSPQAVTEVDEDH